MFPEKRHICVKYPILSINAHKTKWLYLVILSIIWGSSFILIKKGLLGLSALQVGAMRIVFTTIFLLPIGLKSVRTLTRAEWKYVALSGVVGTLVPSFMFAFAETEIDSAVASILNSLTPLNTLLLGVMIFHFGIRRNQVVGVVIGLVGCLTLILAGAELNPQQNYLYSGLVLIATLCYAVNVNLIKKHLNHVSATAIATGNFIAIILPTLMLLVYSDFFQKPWGTSKTLESLGYIALLAVFGTGIAKVMFNRLIQISTPVFASSVTYTIPIIAIFWGLLDGEQFGMVQLVGALAILLGVYLVNKDS